jgi:hypothetical protein
MLSSQNYTRANGGEHSTVRRARLKADLMAVSPRCKHCGVLLIPGTPTNPHLVREALSCREHVEVVRAAEKARMQTRYGLTEAGRRRLARLGSEGGVE